MIDIYGRVTYRDAQGALQFSEQATHAVPAEFIEIGYEWHGGQSSALYSMSSCGSVASGIHKNALLYEVRGNLHWVNEHIDDNTDMGMPTEKANLERLIQWLDSLEFPDENDDTQ